MREIRAIRAYWDITSFYLLFYIYSNNMKTEIEIIKDGKTLDRVSSIRKACKYTNVAEVFIANHLGDGVVSYNGYSFNRVTAVAVAPGRGGRPVGYKCSGEVRERMSEAARKRMQDPGIRRKISDALSDYWIKKKSNENNHG